MRKRQKAKTDKEKIFESIIGGSYWDFDTLAAISYLSRFTRSFEGQEEPTFGREPLLIRSGEQEDSQDRSTEDTYEEVPEPA